MTSRVQVFRTPTTGVAPAAGTRQPGELWLNFADFALGFIDASKTAQRITAVRYFQTTANYAVGDFVIQGGSLYVANQAVTAGAFSAPQWTRITTTSDITGAFVPIAGGTMTGLLTLSGAPTANLHAATKAYADSLVSGGPFLPLGGGTLTGLLTLSGPPIIPLHAATKAYVDSGAFVPIAGGTMTGDLILNRDAQVPLGAATKEQVDARGAGDNRIINGDCRIDQRNAGASGTAGGYTVDRWNYTPTQASKGTWGRNMGGAATIQTGFVYYLGFQSSSAYTPLTSDTFIFTQLIEADMITDCAFGQPNAQPLTLSFWAYSSLTGTFSGALYNYPSPPTRSYPFTFSLPSANVWTKIVITIPGDTAGAWTLSGNAAWGGVRFDLGSGATYRSTAGSWQNGNYSGVTGAVNTVATSGAYFLLTGVKLEVGSIATPYNRQSLAKSMADCQRYYEVGGQAIFSGNVTSGSAFYNNVVFKVNKRAAPTVVCTDQGVLAFPAGAPSTAGGILVDCFLVNKTANVTGSGFYQFGWTASAEL